MAKWEYAAIVGDSGRTEWALRQGENEFECYVEVITSGESKELLAMFGKDYKIEIISPTEFKVKFPPLVHSWNIHLNDWKVYFKSEEKQMRDQVKSWNTKRLGNMFNTSIKSCKYKSSGRINKSLFKSHDILELINKAGAAGWEITGGIGLDNFQWRESRDGGPTGETKWRIMRREL